MGSMYNSVNSVKRCFKIILWWHNKRIYIRSKTFFCLTGPRLNWISSKYTMLRLLNNKLRILLTIIHITSNKTQLWGSNQRILLLRIMEYMCLSRVRLAAVVVRPNPPKSAPPPVGFVHPRLAKLAPHVVSNLY